jgi:hypothetical protein
VSVSQEEKIRLALKWMKIIIPVRMKSFITRKALRAIMGIAVLRILTASLINYYLSRI